MNRKEENDQLTQILEAVEHPERYTDEQLQQLLGDDQCRDYYRLMCEATSAYADTYTESEAETEAAWEAFRQQHYPRQRYWWKIAAAFIGVVMLSGISYAAVSYIRHAETRQQPVHEVQTPSPQKQQAPALQEEQDDTTYTFKDVELQDILSELATHYQLHTEYRNEQARHTRIYIKWNKMEDAQTMIERLNHFEKVNIRLANGLMIAE